MFKLYYINIKDISYSINIIRNIACLWKISTPNINKAKIMNDINEIKSMACLKKYSKIPF